MGDRRFRTRALRLVAALSVCAAASVPLSGVAQAGVPQAGERVLNPDNMHWYQRIDTAMWWQAARDYCAARQGHLVTVDSASENAFVYHLAESTWLGGTDRGTEGDWKWVTGEPWSYTNWAPNEPNNSDVTRGVTRAENYMNFKPGFGGQWNDVVDHPLGFVCEWERPYVAMGDSYSSGEGNPSFDPGTGDPSDDPPGNGCHRSQQAWPRLVTEGASSGYVQLIACSGASIPSLVEPYGSEPPQLAQLAARLAAGSGPSVVTITIGGNDLHFAEILGQCAMSDCVRSIRLAESHIGGRDGLVAGLAWAYRLIRATAPQAKLVVVGYPNLFPESRSANVGCPWLSPLEQAGLVHLAKTLDSGIRSAARQAGASYVSTLHTLYRHELCTADSWVYPIDLFGGQNRGHPTLNGQRAIARAVRPYVDGLTR